MLNNKKRELSHWLFNKLKKKCPEIELVSIVESPLDPDDVWINVVYPDDEDKEIILRRLAARLGTDILEKHDILLIVTGCARNGKSRKSPRKLPRPLEKTA